MLHPEATEAKYDKKAGDASTFDMFYEQYQNGAFGEPGAEAWATMIEKFSGRTKVELVAGATALTGRYDELSVVGSAEVEAFDTDFALRHPDRLSVEPSAEFNQ